MDMTPDRRAQAHRELDEALTHRMEAFLHGRRGAPEAPFTIAEFVEAIGMERFGRREAQLLLVALESQRNVHHDRSGWYAGPPPMP
jgi:hypothetical protein